MQRQQFALLFIMLSTSLLSAGPFSLQREGEQVQVLYRGTPLISEVVSLASSEPSRENRKVTESRTADGGMAINIWSEELESRFRTEIAVNGEGTEVEITYLSEAPAYHKETTSLRMLKLKMPFSRFSGSKITGYVGRATTANQKSGTIDATMPSKKDLLGTQWRYLATDNGKEKLVFDFNPIGPGDFISIYKNGAVKGNWQVIRRDDTLECNGGSVLYPIGGMTGAKIRILEGDMATYDQLHALRNFMYSDRMPPNYHFCFGAKTYGKQYTAVNHAHFDETKGYGWTNSSDFRLKSFDYPGAYYSFIKGENKTFRFTNLPKGVWLLTLGLGNPLDTSANCAFSVNGQLIEQKLHAEPWHAVTGTLPIWVDSGTLEIKFRNQFHLSTLSLQRLLATAEDFSFRRGLWVTDGYEPSVLFRNEHYRPEPVFALDLQSFELPKPGEEAKAPRKEIPVTPPCAAPRTRKGLEWRDTAIFGRQSTGNSATMAELDTPESRQAFWKHQADDKATAVIMSGLHSRHTYARSMKRSQEFLKSICAEGHQHGLKILDHHDTTLLWNLDSGFRVLAERLPEVTRTVADNMPSYQICINNPEFNRKYKEYLLDIVRNGIDGFMIDESTFYSDCCGCQHCRKKFHDETGWYLPVNETDPFFTDKRNPIHKLFLDWRKITVGNWWADIRKSIDAINPAVSLLVYSTHYGFTSNYATLQLGADLLQDARGADFIGTEIMSRNVVRSARAILPYRKAKNLLRTAYDIPIWGLVQTQHSNYGAYFGWAIMTMHQQCAWMTDSITQQGPANFQFLTAQYPDIFQAQNSAKVALLFSSSSRDWAPAGGFLGELFGTAQTLESMHVPYEIIGEMSLTPQVLGKYKVLIAAGQSCLSEKETRAMLEFCRNGGTLMLTTNTGFYDEQGTPVKTWPFAEALGTAPRTTSTIKPTAFVMGEEQLDIGATAIAWPMLASQVKGEVLATALPPGKTHAVWSRCPYGQGEFYYLNAYLASPLCAAEGTPGRKWDFNLNPKTDALFRRILAKVTAPAAVWQTNAPDAVYTAVYQLDGTHLVHFLNAQGSLDNKVGAPMELALPKDAFPALTEDITFTLNRDKVTSAYAVSVDFEGKQPIPFEETAPGQFTFTLPKNLLKVYTVIFVK